MRPPERGLAAATLAPTRAGRRLALRRHVAELFRGGPEGGAPGRVGLEVEVIPVRPGAGPPEPVPVAALEPALRLDGGLWEAARVSFEPGGQLEISPRPAAGVAAALGEVDALMARVQAALPGVALHAGGTNPWHTREELGLQVDRPRYRVMQAHFRALGPAGTRMMRQTAALQVSLDLGGGEAAAERWRVLNLAGPALSAVFANSPRLEGRETDLASTRSWIWQGADPTRTGFDMAQVGAPGEEAAAYTAYALAATAIPLPRPGLLPAPADGTTLAAWIAEEGPRPDDEDTVHHLSTLFPPVRPRLGPGTAGGNPSGPAVAHLEVRYLDALPRRWAEVAVATLATLAYVPRARGEALALLERAPRGLPAWAAAAEHALRDDGLAAVALALMDVARRGMAELPAGYLSPSTLALTDRYLERFTRARRAPADDELERGRAHPEDPLPWT